MRNVTESYRCSYATSLSWLQSRSACRNPWLAADATNREGSQGSSLICKVLVTGAPAARGRPRTSWQFADSRRPVMNNYWAAWPPAQRSPAATPKSAGS